MLSSERDGAQASIISLSGSKCSSSQEISSRERFKFDGTLAKRFVIVEEHPRNERCFRVGKIISASSTGCDVDPALEIEQQSPGRMVRLLVHPRTRIPSQTPLRHR